MKEDNFEKVRRLWEECDGGDEYPEVKQHSVYLAYGCPGEFYRKYIRQCKGVMVFNNRVGGFHIHKWGTHIGVPVKLSFLYAIFRSIEFDVKNHTIKINTQWDDESPVIEEVGKFKPEVFKELYETIPEFLKSHGIYDYKESWDGDLLTLNIITNVLVKLQNRINRTGRFHHHFEGAITRLKDGLEYKAIYNNRDYLVKILYEESVNRYSIWLAEQEYGFSQQSKLVKEADLLDTLDEMLQGADLTVGNNG